MYCKSVMQIDSRFYDQT